MNPELFALLIPILALMIPIVAVMTKHQQRMAEIIHINQSARPDLNSERMIQEIQSLRLEVSEVKQLLHQQTIAMDGMQAFPSSIPMADRLDLQRP